MNVTVPTPVGELAAYFAAPVTDSGAPWPGVVVVHEALGLNDDTRSIADRFAAEGYGVVAPDLFSWAATPRCLVSSFRDLLRRTGPAHDRIDATWARGHIRRVQFCRTVWHPFGDEQTAGSTNQHPPVLIFGDSVNSISRQLFDPLPCLCNGVKGKQSTICAG